MTLAPSITFENVSKGFPVEGGEKVVVRDLTLALPRGRSPALLGRNGAGKSTLLSLIAGSAAPDRGRILRHARVSFPLGFSGAFHRQMTGAQNARFVARIYGVEEEALVAYVREFSELGPFMEQPVRVYSQGMRARLAFGISMAIRFDVYLVDELTAVGDRNFKQKSRAVFESRLAQADVVMVSHSVAQLRRYCDCGLVLEDGRLEVFDDLEAAIARHLDNMRRSAPAPDRRRPRPGVRRARRAAAKARRAAATDGNEA